MISGKTSVDVRLRLLRHPATLAVLFVAAFAPVLAGPAPAQTYFIPASETQVRATFLGTYTGTGTSVWNVISLSPGSTNTVIYYDHHENGYEPDLANPANIFSATNPGGTQVWGDNNPSNGLPPGFASDVIGPGKVIVLTNSIPLPHAASRIYYDGGDKIASTRAIAVTLVSWPLDPGPVLADGIVIYDTSLYGTNFVSPVGVNACTDQPYPMFSYSALTIMPAQDGTVVQVDTNADGTFDLSATINRGESFMANSNGALRAGAEVKASKPVQVHLFTGRRNSAYQSRWFTLDARERWSTNYYAPVGTTKAGYPAGVVLFNPYTNALAVKYSTRTTANGVTNLPARSTRLLMLPTDSGASFSANRPFTGVNVVDVPTASANNNGDQYDWGCTLLPDSALTPSILVGYGGGSADLSANGSPVWVVALKPTTLFVDFDANPATGPLIDGNNNRYDVSYAVTNYQSKRIFNTSGNNNQTGMRVYTTNGVKIVAAWGEDPATASTGNPFVDAGTTIFGLPDISGGKTAQLFKDVNGNGACEPRDEILYTLHINNEGGGDLPNVILLDPLPSNTLYVAGTATLNGIPVADNVAPFLTPYPFDEGGLPLATISSFSSVTLAFRVRVGDPFPLTVSNILNAAVASAPAGRVVMEANMPVVQADLALAKSVSRPFALPGSNFLYTVTVTNRGPNAVTGVTVRDALPDGIGYVSGGAGAYNPANGIWAIGAMKVGSVTTLQFTARALVPGCFTNTAEVHASSLFDPNSTPSNGVPTENDYGTATILSGVPAVALVKTAGSAPDGNVLYVLPGSNVVYTYRVINTGDIDLANIVVTDDVLGLVGSLPAPLAPGAAALLYATHANVTNSVVNVGVVSAAPAFKNGSPIPGTPAVTDSDPAAVVVSRPAIGLVKKAGDAAAQETLYARAGTNVVYTYEIVVTGDTALTNVTVVDDKLGLVGVLPGPAAPGSTSVLYKTHAALAASVTNTAVATGWPVNGLPAVTAQCQAFVKVVAPGIAIVKTADSEPDGGTHRIRAGMNVPYFYRVTNTGDTRLVNITVTDDKLGPVGTIPGPLAPGEYSILTRTATAVTQSVTNIGTATATPADFEGRPLRGIAPVSAADNAIVQVVRPAVSIVQTAGNAPDGGTYYTLKGSGVPYTYQVANTGDTPLISVTVTDDKLGLVGSLPGVLAPGQSRTLYKTNSCVNSCVTNLGSVSGAPCLADGTPLTKLAAVTDTDDAIVKVFLPAVDLVKTAGTAPDGAVLYALPGSNVVYTYRVVNQGDSWLANIAVTDNVLGVVGALPGPLAPGASALFHATHANLTNSVVNVGLVSATPALSTGVPIPNLPMVTDTDPASVVVSRPGVRLVKTAGDAADMETLHVRPGSNVVYTFEIVVTGDTALTNVTVTDDKLGFVGVLPGPIAPRSTNYLYKTHPNTTVSVTNTALATGWPVTGLPPVSDQHQAFVKVVRPGLGIVKTADGAADGETCFIRAGTDVPYSYRVTNTGDTWLVNIAVTDDKLGAVGTIAGPLAPGAQATLTRTAAAVARNVVNIGTATGTPADAAGVPLRGIPPVGASDEAVVQVVGPAVDIVHTAGNAPDGGIYYTLRGSPVPYRYRVVNTGDTCLTNVTVSGDRFGFAGTLPGVLAPGESRLLDGSNACTACDVTNLGTVAGTPSLENGTPLPKLAPVTDTDDAIVKVFLPAVGIVKTAGSAPDGEVLYALPGANVVFAYAVSNAGDTYLADIVVTDDVLGVVGTIPGPVEPGWSTNLYATQANLQADVVNVALAQAAPVLPGGTALPGFEPVSATDDADTRIAFFTVHKEDSPDPVRSGKSLTYVVWVANPSPNPVFGLTVTEQYPDRFVFTGAAPAPSSGNNMWTLDTLEPGGLIPIVISGTAARGTPDGAILTNTVTVTSVNGGSVTVGENTRVTAGPGTGRTEIRVTKRDDADPVPPGSDLTYTIRVENFGPITASNVVVTETYDPLFTVLDAAPAAVAGTSNVWALGKMAANTVAEIVVHGRVSTLATNGGVLFNTVTATARNADPSSDAELTLVGVTAGPEIAKTASIDPVLGNHSLIYTVTVANVSQTLIPRVTVIESFDPNFLYSHSEPAPLGGSSNAWFLGDLPPGATTNIVITGIVSKRSMIEDVLFNTAEVVSGYGSRTVHLSTRVINPPPNPVTLLSFRAVDSAGGVKLKWETATELENLGFNLYRARSPEGNRVRVNAALVPSSNNADGKRYVCLDATAKPGVTYYYWLEEVASNYKTTLYGPVERPGTDAGGATRPPERFGTFRTTPKGGLYRIRYEVLEAAGLRPGSLDPDALSVTVGGRALPLYVNAEGGALQPGDFVLFYSPPSSDGMACDVTAEDGAARMPLADARPSRSRGDVYTDQAGKNQKVVFLTDPGCVRYFLTDFAGAPVWVLDVTESTNAVMLYGYAYATLTNGETAVYLSYDREGETAKCLAVQDDAVIDVPRLGKP